MTSFTTAWKHLPFVTQMKFLLTTKCLPIIMGKLDYQIKYIEINVSLYFSKILHCNCRLIISFLTESTKPRHRWDHTRILSRNKTKHVKWHSKNACNNRCRFSNETSEFVQYLEMNKTDYLFVTYYLMFNLKRIDCSNISQIISSYSSSLIFILFKKNISCLYGINKRISFFKVTTNHFQNTIQE